MKRASNEKRTRKENIMSDHLERGPFVVCSVSCWDKTVASSKVAKIQEADTAGKTDEVVAAQREGENGGISDVNATSSPSPIKSHLSSEVSKISTGLGFLDHMVDQLNSHAQIGVSILVSLLQKEEGEENPDGAAKDTKNRFADTDQSALMELVGSAIGEQLYPLLHTERRKSPISTTTRSRFCCPLDEALVECQIAISSSSEKKETKSPSITYDLAPYGKYPKTTGRTQIGHMKTAPLQIFWTSLAKAMQLDSLILVKIRGDNGHHVVESSFKAFSRALRCLIDGTSQEKMEVLWGKQSDGFAQGVALKREAAISRSTKETSIDVKLKLDGGVGRTHIETGIPLLDEVYQTIVKQCECMSLQVNCKGDLWVDDHHTVGRCVFMDVQ
jgi:imidazoleglycerol phosphate dehydratase HisB